MNDGKIKLRKEEWRSCLVVGKFLFGVEVSEVVMICSDFERNRVSFKVVLEGFKGTNDGKEFLVMDVIVLLSG